MAFSCYGKPLLKTPVHGKVPTMFKSPLSCSHKCTIAMVQVHLSNVCGDLLPTKNMWEVDMKKDGNDQERGPILTYWVDISRKSIPKSLMLLICTSSW